VRGRFRGELVVRKRLLIRAGGHVSGTITYGEVEIESGGKISGAIQETKSRVLSKRSVPPMSSPISGPPAHNQLPGSNLVLRGAFSEAFEPRRQIAQMLFDRGRRSVSRQTSSLGRSAAVVVRQHALGR
jgi:hypothetical protein